MSTPTSEIFERNMRVLESRSPRAAKLIRGCAAQSRAEFFEASDGSTAATLDGKALCSKRRPLDEARSWAKQIDPHEAGLVGVTGFGLGHHVAALAGAHKHKSLIVCCEPDLALLRAVLERVDHSGWIAKCPFILLTDPNDRNALSVELRGKEALMATGVEIVPHPPSAARLKGIDAPFSAMLLEVIRTTRTHVVTLLAHAGVTMRNFVMNLDHYATRPGLTPLRGSCAGRPAILVAAGPSVHKNLDLLADPSVREHAVIIAVQTMLKPMLERGIKPHFVTALDHSEISKRFYEGLTLKDVEGVRLIAEPKANPAILDSFPGEIVCPREVQLDKILGEELTRDMGAITAGSTVAHLNYYLARELGCTDIVLIGQDLGFSDYLYYAPGAAIHTVWAPELSEHRTLETLEFERVMRVRSNLRDRVDVYGRPMLSDEQMNTYIAQFEADFSVDTREKGVRVIDASEGGARIAHTQVMTLREALGEVLTDKRVELPNLREHAVDDEITRGRVVSRIKDVAAQCKKIESHSDRTLGLLDKAISHKGDAPKIDKAVRRIHEIRERVNQLQPALGLIGFINQKGGLARFRTDREIALLEDLAPGDRQQRQLERDKENVEIIKDAATEVRRLLERAAGVMRGEATKQTRAEETRTVEQRLLGAPEVAERRVEAVIFADPDIAHTGAPRDLGDGVTAGHNALALTIERLAACEQLQGVTVVTPDEDKARTLIGASTGFPVRVLGCDADAFRARAGVIAAARSASRACWRGSIGGASCYDESLEPSMLATVMDEHAIDAAVIVGADWALVDPVTTDKVVKEYRGDPEHNDVVFTQAAPGLAGCLVTRRIATALAERARVGSTLSTIGSLLSYNPREPRSDQIATHQCVAIDTAIRDAGVRFGASTVSERRALHAAVSAHGPDAPLDRIISSYTAALRASNNRGPGRVVIELCTGRLSSGVFGETKRSRQDVDERPVLSLKDAHTIIREAATLRDDLTVLYDGAGDPLMRPDATAFVALADELGATCVELRTDLLSEHTDATGLVESGLGVLSVDVLADTPTTYHTMTGTDRFDAVLDTMQRVFDARTSEHGALPQPWVLPRITKCDASVDDLRSFTDRWLTVCGCAAIDPLAAPRADERIAPLPVPSPWAERLESDTLRIRCDGTVIDHRGVEREDINVLEVGVEAAFRDVRRPAGDPLLESKNPVLGGSAA